jgi:iron transport multicopper oxidase
MAQYPDGLRGPLIVHDPKPPVYYDDEFTITLTEWYHRQMPDLLNEYESRENYAHSHGNEPIPDSALINDATNTIFKVEPNKTYLVRIICVGNWPGHAFLFDDHEMTVVEVDGVWLEPFPVGERNVRLATAQRMSVLIHTKEDASKNYAFWDTMDINMMFFYENRAIPEGYNPNATAWLVYDEAKPLPPPPTIYEFNFVDDLEFVPADREPLLEPVDHQIVLHTGPSESNGVIRFSINNQQYLPQQVPSLYTALTVGPEYYSDPRVYGSVNPFVINYGEVVEIVINNYQGNLHPWHLHGHQFQVLQRSDVDGGYFNGYYGNISSIPVKRDTIMVQNHGHAVIRFRADNPDMFPPIDF